jgi:hypothetical protein
MSRLSKRSLSILGVVAVVAALSVTVSIAYARHGGHRERGLTPENIAALTSARTRLPGLPGPARALGLGQFSPTAGTVHALGAGALAWTKQGRVCFYQRLSSGCIADAAADKPFFVMIGDPDVVGGGAPPWASGMATDAVKSVVVRFDDGRIRTGDVVRNFYDIKLPADVGPSSSFTVAARLENGTTYSERVPGS